MLIIVVEFMVSFTLKITNHCSFFVNFFFQFSAENYLEMIENVTRQMDVAYENYQRNEEKSDEGLVPMLRTGMIALQLLPSNCLAGVVVFTDGCTDVYVDQEMIF